MCLLHEQMWLAHLAGNEKRIVRDFYRLQRSCGQGNIFTPVCHSVHRGGLPQCMLGYPPPDQTPPEQTPPWDKTPIPDQTPLGPDTPRDQTSPGKQILAYRLRAAGTHPTGMHSCLNCLPSINVNATASINVDAQFEYTFKLINQCDILWRMRIN